MIHSQLQITTIEQLRTVLLGKYGTPSSLFTINYSLLLINKTYPHLADWNGKTVLDIGCGASSGNDFEFNPIHSLKDVWAPWFLRAARLLGATCTGVDLNYNVSEQGLTFLRTNLITPGALNDLPDGSFDAINCTNFFSSPTLVLGFLMKDGVTKYSEIIHTRQSEILRNIQLQIDRLLKPGGKIVHLDKEFDNY